MLRIESVTGGTQGERELYNKYCRDTDKLWSLLTEVDRRDLTKLTSEQLKKKIEDFKCLNEEYRNTVLIYVEEANILVGFEEVMAAKVGGK